MDGFFLVDKPKGMTSFDVVYRIKKQFKLKKCGHSGTLDPNTTGLLIVACDKATKLLKLLQAKDKIYDATICFGYDSNTLDFDGTITKDIVMNFDEAALDLALEEIQKRKTQLPPMVSAIKVNGHKLYEYERKQVSVLLAERPIELYSIKKLSSLRLVNQHLEVDLRIHCSKGFYVRSFAKDLGIILQGCAILKELRRIASGSHLLEHATSLTCLQEANLKNIQEIFPNFGTLEVEDYIAKLVRNGVTLDERQTTTTEPFFVTNHQKSIAIYEPIEKNRYKPILIYTEGE